jgi:hypothetical protein
MSTGMSEIRIPICLKKEFNLNLLYNLNGEKQDFRIYDGDKYIYWIPKNETDIIKYNYRFFHITFYGDGSYFKGGLLNADGSFPDFLLEKEYLTKE